MRCGWSKFCWRFQCSFCDSFETDCQQNTIWFAGESFITTIPLVLEGACSETMVHFIIRCDIFGNLLHLIFQSVGISFISLESVSDHLHHFGHLTGLWQQTHNFVFSLGKSLLHTFCKMNHSCWIIFYFGFLKKKKKANKKKLRDLSSIYVAQDFRDL